MKLLTRLKQSFSSSQRRAFLNLTVFYAAYQWFKSFSTAVLNPYLLEHGLTMSQLFTGDLIFFTSAFCFQLILPQIRSRLSWRLALITSFLSILLLAFLTNVYHFYLSNFLAGLSMPLFYVVYNTAHFKLTPKHRTGFSAAVLFSIAPIITFLTPLLAGFVAHFNYLYIWLLSGLFFFLVFYLVRYQINSLQKFTIKFSTLTSTRVFIFLEGIWEILYFSLIPYYSLYFITTPLYYGVYLSYLSLLSIASNLILGRLTDKLQKRIIFLYPVTLTMALVTFLFPLALNQIIYWIIITGLIRFLTPQFWNLSTSMMVDTANSLLAFSTREFILSFSRATGLVLVLINFAFQTKPTYIFYLFGLVMFLFPLILFYNTRISRKHQYL